MAEIRIKILLNDNEEIERVTSNVSNKFILLGLLEGAKPHVLGQETPEKEPAAPKLLLAGPGFKIPR
jgi:hypothetical protein